MSANSTPVFTWNTPLPTNSGELFRNIFEQLSAVYPSNEAKAIAMQICSHFLEISTAKILANTPLLSTFPFELFALAVQRLLSKEPLQYILGETEFYSLVLKVAPGVLIPRPETEELVHLILKENPQANTLLDIGTGSGSIALALAHNLPNAKVFAIDVSEQALEIAKVNAQQLQLEVTFYEKDILKDSLDELPRFDIIVSNPPYVRQSEKKLMQANVLDHEPELALFVDDDDPLLFYRQISELATKKLNKGGKLYFEINEAFGLENQQLLETLGFHSIRLFKDLNGKERMLTGIWG